MVQLKVFSLFILATITLINGCGNHMEKDESKINCSNTIIFNSNEIKISLEKNEYSLVRSQNLYEISILNKGKLDSIREITISIHGEEEKEETEKEKVEKLFNELEDQLDEQKEELLVLKKKIFNALKKKNKNHNNLNFAN